MTWRLPCALRGGHRWATLGLEAGRAYLECACGARSSGWELPDRIGPGLRGRGMHVLLRVAERTEKADGTVVIVLHDPHLHSCSVIVTETHDQPFRVGDRYDLTLTPLARLVTAPVAGGV
jgi:hypothetical protein